MTVEDSFALANKINEFYINFGPTAAKNASAIASEHGLIFQDINQHLTSISDEDCVKFRFHSVTDEDVSKIIKNLPSNKAPGYDKVTARVLKDSSPVTVPIITNLINGSFFHNTFPNAWKMAEVIPIQTSGDYEDPANTRPASLLPIVSKVCERSALCQFMHFLDSNGIIHHSQSGNRKLHPTETALLHFTDELLKNMDKKIAVIVLLDMSKAFDSIRHDLLINKLHKLGVSFVACTWFLSYLSQRMEVVKIADSLSEPLPLKAGVPQGSILSPVLFTLYVNDLLQVPKHCRALGYVDNTKVFMALPSGQLPECCNISEPVGAPLRRGVPWHFMGRPADEWPQELTWRMC